MEVRTARNGSRYLVITDYRLEEDGARPFKGVMVFDDHASEFLWSLIRALGHLQSDGTTVEDASDAPDAGDAYAKIRLRYPRAYEPWTPGEESRLRLAYSQGMDARRLGAMLGRQPSAIRSRLRHLGLCN
jgi:hypothetical protein